MKIVNYKNLDEIYIIKGFFSKKEISELFNCNEKKQDYIFGNYGKIIPSFFLKYKKIKHSLKLSYLESVLSKYFKNTIKVTDHSDYHNNTYGNWHTDCGPNNSYLPRNFYDKNNYSNIFKCAVFNQAGTQTPTQFYINNEVLSVPLMVGDILIFRIELTHRSRRIFKFLKFFSFWFYLKNKFNSQNNRTRKAIFFTLGYKGKVLNYFYNKNLEREISQYKKAIHF